MSKANINYSGFNPQQAEAIRWPADKDLLISAGAGSGKTKTLSVRVYRLVKEGEVDPSSLLVLTFTNNAAHEMKERIIATCAQDDPELAAKMNSAHVQTFDSFSHYLVTKYAGRLGISSSIELADEAVMQIKRKQFLDEVFEEYYADPEKSEKLFKTLVKFNTKGDFETKKIILDIDKELQKILPEKRLAFRKEYEERFLSEAKLKQTIDAYVKDLKAKIEFAIRKAYFLEKHIQDLEDDPKRALQLAKFAAETNVEALHFDEGTTAAKVCEDILYPALQLDGMEFVNFFQTEEHFKPKGITWTKPRGAIEDSLKKLFQAQSPLMALKAFPKEETQILPEMKKFYEDICLLFDLIDEMNLKLNEYKRATNRFTFADISSLALRLLTESQFADIAAQIRSRFTYIMVDEYQDTNDFQETFINSLLQPDENGKRSHLFCVGDAKQSIYAFRNSNVELFRKRQADLGQDHVINMNFNYRSGEKLLNDINYLFIHYMRQNHGSIDYYLPSEQLKYDKKVNLYGEPFGNFGVRRLLSSYDQDGNSAGENVWELNAIIKDIQAKVANGFTVYDRNVKKGEPHIRPCRYSDFVILTRSKSNCFPIYQRRFNEVDIPLNLVSEASLAELDPIMVLQSAFGMLAHFRGEETANLKHLYASLARSYIFRESHDDALIHKVISYKPLNRGGDEFALLKQDPIYLQFKQFASEHRDSSLSQIFLDMVNDLGLVRNLPHVGMVADNIAKIEALYQVVLSLEKAGEGILEFIELFKNVRNYDLSIDAKSEFNTDNAVTLMTIHASKGLEQKIVYMPCSYNQLSGGNNMGKPDYQFSPEHGILLHDYGADILHGETGFRKGVIEQIVDSLSNKKDAEIDEHVRLFYVALTRAENLLYIVGKPKKRSKETLYDLLDSAPHCDEFNPAFIATMEKVGVIDPALHETMVKKAALYKDRTLPCSVSDFAKPSDYEIYVRIIDECHFQRLQNQIDALIKAILEKAYDYYSAPIISAESVDLDQLSFLYASWYVPTAKIKDFAGLCSYLLKENKQTEKATEEGLKATLEEFLKAIKDCLGNVFGGNDKNRKTIIGKFLAKALGGFDYVLKTTYQTSAFDDVVEFVHLDENDISGNSEKSFSPNHVHTDDSDLPFSVRTHKKASRPSPIDEDPQLQASLSYGVKLHRLMELVDFHSKDTSFISSEKDRKIIDKVLALPLFNDLENTSIYKEYGFYDKKNLSHGYIDLLLVKDGIYTIIDYKTKDIEEDAYVDQLGIYEENVKSIFGVDSSHIRKKLLSLVDGVTKDL